MAAESSLGRFYRAQQHRAPRLLYAASGRSRSSMDFHEIAVMTSLPVDKVKSVCKGMKDDASAIENALNSYLDNKSGPFKEAADGPGGAFSEITKQRRPKKVNIARLRPCQAAPPLPAMPRSLFIPSFYSLPLTLRFRAWRLILAVAGRARGSSSRQEGGAASHVRGPWEGRQRRYMRAHAVDLSDTPSHTGPAAAAAFYFCSGATRRPLSAMFSSSGRALADPAYRLVAHTRVASSFF